MAASDAPILGLRIFGDTLEPAELTALLGQKPTECFKKGDRNIGANGREYVRRKTGMWLLEASENARNVERSVLDLFAGLPNDLGIWKELGAKFELIFTVGLFMDGTNEEFYLPSTVLEALGIRGISTNLDIYAPTKTPEQNEPCPCGSGLVYSKCCAVENL